MPSREMDGAVIMSMEARNDSTMEAARASSVGVRKENTRRKSRTASALSSSATAAMTLRISPRPQFIM